MVVALRHQTTPNQPSYIPKRGIFGNVGCDSACFCGIEILSQQIQAPISENGEMYIVICVLLAAHERPLAAAEDKKFIGVYAFMYFHRTHDSKFPEQVEAHLRVLIMVGSALAIVS